MRQCTLILAGVATLCGLMPGNQGVAADLVLVREGKAQARIVVTAGAEDRPARFAADELRRYIQLMSGATLPVGSGDASVVIELIVDAQVLPPPRPTPDDPRTQDRYRLRVSPTGIQIAGASGRAVLFGAYDLLERLGCGWCVPGDDTVPRKPTLSLGVVDVDTQPAFEYRMMLDFPMRSVEQTAAIADWLAKNRMNWIHPCENAHGEPKLWYERRSRSAPEIGRRGLHLIFGGHTMHTWCPETNFEAHPDWFALVDGKRKAPTLCVSNPQAVEEVVKNIRAFLDCCPEVEVVDLWHPDGQVFCHCPACTRGVLGADSGGTPPAGLPHDSVHAAYVISFLTFINQVANALAQTHPAVRLSPLIYGSSDRALPDAAPALADNVLYGLAHIFRDSYRPLAGSPKSSINMRFLGNDVTWMAKARRHYIYEYYNCWWPPFIYPGSQVIVRDLQILHELGAQGSSSDMYGYSPINMYVAARALWDPGVSWEAVVRDFCSRYYGDVAEAMADNRIKLEHGIFGKAGFQANGASEGTLKFLDPACGEYLRSQRPAQIAFLEQLLTRTSDDRVKTRLRRDLQPWQKWGGEARYWGLPEFVTGTASAPDAEFAQPPGVGP